jgi:hypothetical protein
VHFYPQGDRAQTTMRRRTTATKASHDHIDIATPPTLEAEGLDTLPAAGPRADSARVTRPPEPDTTAQVQAVGRGVRLSTRRPPRCVHCRRSVNPEFMEVTLYRKLWVFVADRAGCNGNIITAVSADEG